MADGWQGGQHSFFFWERERLAICDLIYLPLYPNLFRDWSTWSFDRPPFSETLKCCSTSTGVYRNGFSMVW